MMVKRFLLLLPMALLFARCDTPMAPKEVGLNEIFDINVGQETMVRDEALNVVFEGVPEDTRCPVDVECTWEGNAKVVVRLEKDGQSEQIELNTHSRPQEGEFMGYTIRLVDLKPDQDTRRTIPPDAYVAKLVVTKR